MDEQARYGVFLRPDPATCAAVTAITSTVRAQFGLISAGAFPPHITLAGSLPLAVTEDELLSAVDAALAGRSAFPVANAGVRRLKTVIVYDVNELGSAANDALVELAHAVNTAMVPLLAPTEPGAQPADVKRRDRWRGHLSLASHELFTRPDLVNELLEFIGGLPVVAPATFTAEWVAVYRCYHRDWVGAWWQDMTWQHVRSWRLPGPPSAR